nr:hypothetical protein [Tanacetum cinerariifolium]
MLDEIHALSKPVTSNLDPTPQESKVVKNDKVIALGMFRINPFKTSREANHVPNNVRASTRTKPITVSQPSVIPKKDVNSDSNGFSSTGIDNTKTRRPQPRSNTKNNRVPSASKNSRSKNKGAENVYSKVVCAMCKQCLISVNHDECLLNYVYDKNSRGKKQTANVSIKEKQKKRKPNVKKPEKVGFIERLATHKPSKPRSLLRWSPTGRMFDLNGKIITSSEFESQSDCSKGDNACTSNPVEPTIKRFPNATFSLAGFDDLQWGNILITRNDLVSGLPKFKYNKEHLCPSCEQEKSKRASHPPKPVPNSRSKDEAPEVIKTFLKRITVLFQSPVIIIRTDNGTKLKNQVLKEYFDFVGIFHQMSSVRTPQQNGVVERRNQTLVEAARTMLIFSRASLFLLAEAIATAKLDISFLYVIGALCYPKNDREDIKKLGGKGDIGFFIGYSADSCAYRIFNRRTKKIMETMNVLFDELSAMAFEQHSSKPGLQSMTFGQISSGLDLTYAPSTITRTVLAAKEPQVP